MTFHDSFWVVAGGAAPVIALASVVSFGQVRDMRDETHEELLDTVMQVDARVRQWFSKKRVLITSWLGVAILSQGCNIVIQSALLAVSLASLAAGANDAPPDLVVAFEVLGILLLAAGPLMLGRVRELRAIYLGNLATARHVREATPRPRTNRRGQ